MIEAIIIAGVLAASAILIYIGLKPGLKDTECYERSVRRMARTLVRSVEQRAKWDITLNSTADKWARIVLVLQEQFDVEDEWLHIIIGEAQFDMEADNGSIRNTIDRSGDKRTDLGRRSGVDQEHSDDIGIDDERPAYDPGDESDWPGRESSGGTQFFDNGEDTPIPVAE